MTYKHRVRDDLDTLWKEEAAKEFFGYDYKDGLKEAIKQLEGWLIKLTVTQTAIIAFLLAGFVSQEASISLFGISLLLILMFMSLFFFSIAIQVAIFRDIYLHPTLPQFWSVIVLGYVVTGYIVGLFWLVRMLCPLPYRDKSLLLELERLKEIDPAAYGRRLAELTRGRGL